MTHKGLLRICAKELTKARRLWGAIAFDNGWSAEFVKDGRHVQLFYDPSTNKVEDSVSFKGLTEDIIVYR